MIPHHTVWMKANDDTRNSTSYDPEKTNLRYSTLEGKTMNFLWIGGFAIPAIEISILFWLCAIGAGFAYGWLFEDIPEIHSDTSYKTSDEDNIPSNSEEIGE